MYVIALNGPPRSGKDSIANTLALNLRVNYTGKVERIQLSLPMRIAVCGMLCIEYSEAEYERIKDVVQSVTGETFRQTMIRLSEDHVKPRHGKDFWVRSAMTAAAQRLPKVAVISDLGFMEEVAYLTSAVGTPNLLTVNVSRDGTNWDNDSRVPCSGTNRLMVHNDSSLNNAVVKIRNHCRDNLDWRF